MREHQVMFDYVRTRLEKQDAKAKDGSNYLNINYSRFEHTVRVYKWMIRITRELNDDFLDLESLKIATIFHDVGYGLDDEDLPHAQISAQICEDYLEQMDYPHDKVEFICDLIEKHSFKRLLYDKSTPIELVVLMEADMLDDTGAMSLVIDTWVEANQRGDTDTSFDAILKHMERYTMRQMKQGNLVTKPGKKFWHEKRNVVYEFIRQYRRDLGDMK